MLGQQRQGLIHDSLHLGAVVGFGQVEQHAHHLREDFAAVLVGADHVVECRSLRIGQNGLHFGILLFDAGLQGRNIVVEFDFVERRNTVRGIPLLQERILAGTRSKRCCQSHHGKDFLHKRIIR